MPRKTDANEPADWLWISEQDLQGLRLMAEVYMITRYPGFDLDDPDWADLRAKLEAVTELLNTVKERVATRGN